MVLDEARVVKRPVVLETYPLLRVVEGKQFQEYDLFSDVDEGSVRSSRYSYRDMSTSLPDHVVDHKSVSRATFLIRNAISEAGAIGANWIYVPDKDSGNILLNYFSSVSKSVILNSFFRKMVIASAYILVTLSFIEHPWWCRHLEGGCDRMLSMRGHPAFGDDETEIVQYYPNFSMYWLDPTQSLIVEWSCEIVLILFLIFLIGRDQISVTRFLRNCSQEVLIIRLALIWLIGSLLFGLTVTTLWGVQRPFAPITRMLIFITFTNSIQMDLKYMVKMLPELFNILLLLLIIVIFYAWVGLTLFYKTKEGSEHFSSLIEAMWTLYICITTANYPDVMMHAYNTNRLISIYFVSFMLIAYYFMTGVIVASVFNAYNRSESEYQKSSAQNSSENLEKAYDLLDPDNTDGVPKTTLMTIFAILNVFCPDIRNIADDEAEIMFGMLDQDGSDTISREEFKNFGFATMLQFTKVEENETFTEKHFPHVTTSGWYQKMKRFVISSSFEKIIDILLGLNAIVIIIQSFPELSGVVDDDHTMDGELDTVWEFAEALFSVLYFLEMTLKITLLGWRNYTAYVQNVFDATITVLSVAATIYVYYPNAYNNSKLIRYIVMARVLRLSRLIIAIPQFKVIGITFYDLAPDAARLATTLLCVMYIYACIGMYFFGGVISRDPSNPLSARLEGTDYASSEYWSNNFNDMMSSMNELFNLLVVNNWTTVSDGLEGIMETRLTRFFFLSFHIFGVLIANNIVTAFVIDSFMNEWGGVNDSKKLKNKKRSLEALRQMKGESVITDENGVAYLNTSVISGTVTNAQGQYMAAMFGKGKRKDWVDKFFKE